jgi:hypothetical protein
MNNVVRCPHCDKSLIAEELSSHLCTHNGKIVDINYQWWVNSDISGIGEVLIIKAQDGTLFRISPTKSDDG